MRIAIAVLGIVGLGVVWGSVSATAAPRESPSGTLICHATEAGTYEPFYVSSHGMVMDLNGHKGHLNDIIPFPGYGGDPKGQNMTPANVAIYNNGCIGTVATPGGSAIAVPRDATVLAPPAAIITNPGYNVDTGVSAGSGGPIPLWLAAATGVPALAALVVWKVRVRTRSASSQRR